LAQLLCVGAKGLVITGETGEVRRSHCFFLIGRKLCISLCAEDGRNDPFDGVLRNSFSPQALNSEVSRILLLACRAFTDVVFMVARIMKKQRVIDYLCVNWNSLRETAVNQFFSCCQRSKYMDKVMVGHLVAIKLCCDFFEMSITDAVERGHELQGLRI
jgi:hypothetical protein